MSVTLEIERAIRQRADWYRCMLVPEAPVRIKTGQKTIALGTPREYTYETATDYMADFISVTDAGYATEYEVKISRADWLADQKKPKWVHGFPGYISRFIYVVPQALVKKGIPEWVSPMAGVWALVERTVKHASYSRVDTWIEIVRQPKRIGKEKVPDKVLENWRRAFYYRFWRLRIDLDRRISERRERELEKEAA